ncbi:MAG: hypothetical protein EA339_02630 [Rhodobacteraceae bacterium]|nr:MAG: hypothetical protein EA339_02630 [Paracoccaceae bacterium]
MTRGRDRDPLAWVDRHFAVELPFTRFGRNVAVLSLAGLVPALAFYVALALDIPARIGAFVALHLAIYPASAMLFGSFGGDPVQALRVTGPTLAQSAGFANLSGVYLYATLVSALPLHMALLGQALGQFQRAAPVLLLSFAALATFAAQAALLTILAGLL